VRREEIVFFGVRGGRAEVGGREHANGRSWGGVEEEKGGTEVAGKKSGVKRSGKQP